MSRVTVLLLATGKTSKSMIALTILFVVLMQCLGVLLVYFQMIENGQLPNIEVAVFPIWI